jgi:hypothetical protein
MRTLLRPVAVVAAGLITAVTLQAPADASASGEGATWLTRQLNDQHLVHNGQYDFDDYGLTADVAIALDSLGGRDRAVRRIGTALAEHVDSWTTGADFGAPDDVYSGSVAKAAVVASIAGQDPSAFGGVDLVARLEDRTSESAPITGRIEDAGSTDYANTIGQAFAAVALDEAASPEADEALRFLLEQQCADGSFRLTFSGKAAEDQSCDADATSTPDTDATALTVILLGALNSTDPAVDTAVTDAVAWLKATQKESGAFGGGTSTEAANANSTGLAAWALGDLGSCARAEKAADWVRKLQLRGSLQGTPAAGEKGAVGYDRAAYRTALEQGIKRPTRDQWRRASTQAAPGLRFVAGC